MNTRFVRAHIFASAMQREVPLASSCSVLVLSGLGLLGLTTAQAARSQVPMVAAGSLPVLRSVVSGQVVINAPAPGAARSLLTVDQASQRAIIDWRSFDVGKDSEVLFRQPGVTASALNRIYDVNPSVIAGKLTANGQLLLINQNGILFDRGSQVNAQSLVASTLNITNERFLSGVLTGGGLTTPAFQGGYDYQTGVALSARPDGSLPGNITIGGGPADAAAARLDARAGGSILLFAPRIDNAGGVIRAPDGQVILAAGSKAYLALNDDANDITLRGFRVEVEAAPQGTGLNLSSLIRNAGELSADRGNVTLAALAVNQEGRISAKTAVQSNGSIFLKANTKGSAKSGTVTLAAGSITEVVPDATDPTTVPDSQAYDAYRGVIMVSGGSIESSGTLRAPGGRITLTAADAANPDNARVYLGAGSETTVAGVWADVDAGKNLQTFRITSNELKNAPDQKTGALRGASITVDLRQDNNILALDGYRSIVPRTVAEKAGTGGELAIVSTGSVIQRSGAVIDASGGGYRYDAGYVAVSKLLGSDGKIYDIATAPEQQPYTQVLDRYEHTDARWGQTISLANPLGNLGSFQQAYVQGLAGGTVSITSSAGLVLDGTLAGGVTVGARQLASAPLGATLRIGGYDTATNNLAPAQRISSLAWAQQASDTLGAAFSFNSALSTTQRDAVRLASTQVFGAATQTADGRVEAGFGRVELNSNGRIVVPPEVSLASDVGGELILRAAQIDIGGDIRLPAGSLTLQPVTVLTNPVPLELANAGERVVVREGADLSTAGIWINRGGADGSFVGAPTPSARLNAQDGVTRAIDGGSLSILINDPLFQARLERGATLDVSGGASIDSRQRVTGGKGGKLAIANGSANQTSSDWFQVQSGLRGFGLTGGGELSLSLARAEIAGDGANGVLPGNTTRLEAGLFENQGFSNVSVSARDGIDVVAGTTLRVLQKNWVIDPLLAAGLTTAGDLSAVARVQLLPDSQRAAASLVLNARGGGANGSAALNLRQGASITADPKGEISLSALNGLSIDGRINAPGGKVSLTLNAPPEQIGADLHVGAGGVISTAGVFVRTPDDKGLVRGSLVNGGTVTLDARNAGVRVDAGSRIDVSAVNQIVEVPANGDHPALLRQTLEGHAGALIVKAQDRTTIEGALVGHGGSANAAGGSFALELKRPNGQAILPDERRIVVSARRDGVATEAGLVDATVNVAALTVGGFEKLRLQAENRIEFQGSSTLDFSRGIRLDAPLIDVAGDAHVVLNSSTVALGQSQGSRQLLPIPGDKFAWELVDDAASPILHTRLGRGVLSVNAGAVDLFGSFTLNGTRLVRIESDSDIRFIGRPTRVSEASGGTSASRQIGSLTTAGTLELEAAQLYPATRSEFTIAVKEEPGDALAPAGAIRITSNGNAPGAAYSAGGKLILEAAQILQAGVLKAPLGEITLRARDSLRLAEGSVTSVSGNGLTVPYGTTQAGITWLYFDGGITSAVTLDAVTPAGKRIELIAPDIDVRPNATVDLRGGGDVLAAEFVPGNGGDSDITLRDNTFALIPSAGLAEMPYDSHTQSLKDPGFGFSVGNGRDTALYDSILISAGGVVPAGEYTLLPARYALLPNAVLVELQTGAAYRNLQPGQTATLANDSEVIAGFRSARGTTVRESQSVGVVLSPGAAVRRASDYDLNTSALFADAATLNRVTAPRAPWDAGRLAIQDAAALTLDGRFETAASTSAAKVAGRAAEIDISAARIAVVDRPGDATVAAGFVQIGAASLSGLNGSVLLGGTRSDTDNGIRIATRASEVVIANTATSAVRLPELMLAATDRIDVRAGSVLEGSGALSGVSPEVISAEASGAFVRLSAGAQTRVDRGTASGASGDVRIAAGASLSADTALLIDATRSTESFGRLRAGAALGAGGSLTLSSVQVNLGQTGQAATPLSGLVLSNTDLAAYAALDEFVLRGYGAIDLIGDTALGSTDLGRLTLDTPVLRGRATADGQAATTTIVAREIELANHSMQSVAPTGGSGALMLQAERLVVGAGDKSVAGFATAHLTAGAAVASQGEGSLRVAAALTIESPRVEALGGTTQTISAVGTGQPGAPAYAALTLAAATSAVPAASATTSTELGGRLTLEGRTVDVATTVRARSGQITLAARGAGGNEGVTLANGALLDARGQTKDFNGTLVSADGGSVTLLARAGTVALQAGAKVDVSAAAQGGGAGRLTVHGPAFTFAGDLAGRAGDGARSGSAEIDIAALANFSALNAALNAGGFAEERSVRLRSGDLRVAAADVVAARRVTLAADAGRIDVAGTVGTGAANGGARVELFAGKGIGLAAGSRIAAQGSNVAARGGEVRLATRSGSLDFNSAAVIDVRAGDAGPAGSVIFGVSRDANNTLGAATLDGTVRRWSASGLAARAAGLGGDAPASVDVEATRTYTVGSSVGSADVNVFAADHAGFVASVKQAALTGGLRDETGKLAGARVLGSLELQSAAGTLSLASAWNLTDAQWLAGNQPGTLTVRAAGNLTLSQSIGSPDDNILAGDTWNLRLASGADLLAANPLATVGVDPLQTGGGTLRLSGPDAKLRTGSGRIDLAAAGDLHIEDVAATIYTAGRIGAADIEANGNNRWAVDGGSITIRAGGDLSGAVSRAGDLWVNEWLRRNRQPNTQFAALQPTNWWSYRPRFQQGVGTLGGGDIEIAAGGDVNHLAAMLPTSGRTYRDALGQRQVDVQGGGNLSVRAGGDVIGGAFLVARGEGRVEAGGDIGAGRGTQLYVMGTSSGAVPEGAGIDLVAGGALHLQSVNNPTAMFVPNKDSSDPASGPSFGTQGNVATFFTYSATSRAGAFAKSGDLSYQAVLRPTWRTFNRVSPIDSTQTDLAGAFPASLEFVAASGDISGPPLRQALTTFPSTTARVRMLAGGSLFDVGFYGSDRDPASVITPTTNTVVANGFTLRQLDGVIGLQPTGASQRIVSRNVADPFVFELQALEGSLVAGGSSTGIFLTAPSRIRAGVDIVGADLRLQNLKPDDLTEVRADSGDFRAPFAFEIRGPGRLLLQAGRNVDLGTATLAQGTVGDIGGLVATGNSGNTKIPFEQSARVTVVAGVRGELDLSKMAAVYMQVTALNTASNDIIDLYRQLGTEADSGLVLGAGDIATLSQRDPLYARFIALDKQAPQALAAYQKALRGDTVPLGPTANSAAATELYKLLNTELDVTKLRAAGSVAALAAGVEGKAYAPFVALDQRYPLLFSDYVQRRSKGAQPTGVTPIVFTSALADVVAQAVSPDLVSSGNIDSFRTSIQTYGGSDIDLWAPGGNIVVGLTTPRADKTVGVLTNAGGAIRSVLSGDFNINQGKVITAQGGDILMYSSQGSIDAGRGAKTSLATPPPVRKPILDASGNQIGVQIIIPASATGSGIQTLTSDPDGLGPLAAPKAGDVFLFAPAGTIDAGEAGIRSSGNIVLNAQTVLNASNIASAGTSIGVPVATVGSLASSLASGGTNTAATSKAGEESASASASAARAAAAAQIAKPTILVVEVLGFGDKNCKEQDKDCFAK